jgi:hypothetical protein
MRQISRDQNGVAWDVMWGVTDPDLALAEMGVTEQLVSTGASATFQDPLYPDETKTLFIYLVGEAKPSQLAVVSEITPGVYAAGIKK